MAAKTATKARKVRAEFERGKPGIGIKNQWYVWSDKSRIDYRGSFWYNGGKWNAQHSLQANKGVEPGHPVKRFDSARECISYLTGESIEPEQLVGADLALV